MVVDFGGVVFMRINVFVFKYIYRFIKVVNFLVILVVAFLSGSLQAHSPVDYGVEQRNLSGTGTISSFGATSLMYNPANLGVNLSLDALDPYIDNWGEFGLGFDFSYEQSLSYIALEYKHPDYSRLTFHLIAPPTSVGARLSGKNWNLGILFVPLGMNTKQTVSKLPFTLMYEFTELINYSTRKTAGDIYLGGSYKIAGLSIGASVDFLYDKEKQTIEFLDKGSGIEVTKKGKFIGYTLGLRYDSDSFGIGFKFKGKSIRRYDVDRKAHGGLETVISSSAPKPVRFTPHCYGVGIYKVIRSVTLNLEYEFEEFTRGKYISKRGLGVEEPREVAYKNVHGVSLSSIVKVIEGITLMGGFSYFTGNMDKGKFRMGEEPGRQGMGFGDLEAIPHMGVGLGAGMKLFNFDIQTGLRYLFGKKSISGNIHGDTPGEGEYKFRLLMATFRVGF